MPESSIADNKRIARNVIYLYFRMGFIMLVTLYTSRVVLSSLGINDYGIYNVIGGIIGVFGFITGTLSTTTQRFITFELGKGNGGDLNKVFSICILLHLLIGLIVAFVAEPLGLWYIHEFLKIAPERVRAAIWVFQFTIVSMAILFITVPYNALIIAHEKMGSYAIITILDAVLRLAIAYAISLYAGDKLIIYAFLMVVVQTVVLGCYVLYCIHNFPESKLQLCNDGIFLKTISKFAGWSVLGNIAYFSYTQGLNLLLGAFFLPQVSAARAIAVQVQNAVNTFVHNFQTAVNPQITKKIASGSLNDMIVLVFRSSRFSYYLLLP